MSGLEREKERKRNGSQWKVERKGARKEETKTRKEKNEHDGPGLSSGDGSSDSEGLSGEHPPDESDSVLGLVVGGDGNVDELEGSVGITESDNGDVDESGLSDGLVINSGVGNDDDSGLLERSGDVVRAGEREERKERRKSAFEKVEERAREKRRGRKAHKFPGVNRPAMA